LVDPELVATVRERSETVGWRPVTETNDHVPALLSRCPELVGKGVGGVRVFGVGRRVLRLEVSGA
jgi:hypothetical protein